LYYDLLYFPISIFLLKCLISKHICIMLHSLKGRGRIRKYLLEITCFAVALSLSLSVIDVGSSIHPAVAQLSTNASEGSLTASNTSSVGPQNFTMEPEKEPPILTAEQAQQAQKGMEEADTAETPPPLTNQDIQAPLPGSETRPNEASINDTVTTDANAKVRPVSTIPANTFHLVSQGDLKIYVNKYVGSHASVVTEPSAGNKGFLIFYTGNWFAARSLDGGTTWTYNNPFSDMGDFCCDQDVLYDPSHQIFIWYRQANRDSVGENYFRLAISTDTVHWWYYDIKPSFFNSSWTKQWWDYPHLAISNNYLFITSNVFDGTSRAVMSKVSLVSLAAHSAISFGFFEHPFQAQGRRTVTPVQGATDTMYFGTHLSNDQMRIYKWPDASNTISWFDRKIAAWTPSARGSMSCSGPDGFNWCSFADNRVLNGWIRNGVVGFLWNVGQGGGFAFPYLNSATFAIPDMSYRDRPLIWNPNNAWMYGFASPNGRGLGLVAFAGGGASHPQINIAVSDNFQSSPPWHMSGVASGTNGPSAQRWGDYLRVRALNGNTSSCSLWMGTGYVLQGDSGQPAGQVSNSIFPHYFVFGREIDGAPSACYGSSVLPSPSPSSTNATANATAPPTTNATAPPTTNATAPPTTNATAPPTTNATASPSANSTTPSPSNSTSLATNATAPISNSTSDNATAAP
jgi:hypothetical protein